MFSRPKGKRLNRNPEIKNQDALPDEESEP
jgi:hypothetical protein